MPKEVKYQPDRCLKCAKIWGVNCVHRDNVYINCDFVPLYKKRSLTNNKKNNTVDKILLGELPDPPLFFLTE